MAKIYADLLVAGRKQYNQVPAQLQPEMKTILHDYVIDGYITEEKYEQIVGEPYADYSASDGSKTTMVRGFYVV